MSILGIFLNTCQLGRKCYVAYVCVGGNYITESSGIVLCICGAV